MKTSATQISVLARSSMRKSTRRTMGLEGQRVVNDDN